VAAGDRTLDVLYVQVGRVDSYFRNSASWQWWPNMPPAKAYWALWRYEAPARPAEAQIAVIAGDFLMRRAEAAARGQTIIGLQLDYDCPAGDLTEYASFLDKLGKALPDGTKISITALLDWFRPGTQVRDLLAHTSEFVPQFYDAAPSGEGLKRAIAEPIDAARWGPVLNSFGVPYRLGISAFGRILYIHQGSAQAYRDLTPLDVLGRPELKSTSIERTPAGEQRSVMRVERPIALNYWTLERGDQVELIMPTRDSVRAGYDAAQKMGGYCAGIIFFRWPTARESLVLNPAQTLSWITHAAIPSSPPKIEFEEGDCAAVCCSDIQLRISDRLPERAVAFGIRSSRPLEYFLPNPRIKSRITVTGPSSIRLDLPAFHGAGFLYLGRAVTLDPAEFTVREEK